MFTFSFGTAMAATEYTLDDYSKVLEAEKTLQLSYLASAKTQAVNSYTYDKDGFITDASSALKGYMKAAAEAAADEVIADLTTAMNGVINSTLNGTFPTSIAPNSAVGDLRAIAGLSDATTGNGMRTALEFKTDTAAKVQAPLTKAFVEGKLDVDYTKYNSTDKAYNLDGTAGDKLTAVQYIEKLVSEAKESIATADKAATDALKISGYETAYNTFKTALDAVKTLQDEGIESEETVKTVDAAVNRYVAYGIENVYPVVANVTTATFPMNLKADAEGTFAAFYEAKSGANKATLFGVEVGNIEAVTKAEAVAINNAMYAAITDSAKAVKVYAGTDYTKVAPLYQTTVDVPEKKAVYEKVAITGADDAARENVYNAYVKAYGALYVGFDIGKETEHYTTYDVYKDAYAEAQAIIDSVKTKDELKAMKEAVIKQIEALPYTSKLVAADKDTVKAAYDALLAYVKTPGAKATDITNKALLDEKLDKVLELAAAAVTDEAKALAKKLAAVDTWSDADLEAYIALKSEAEELKAAGQALADEAEAINDDKALTTIEVAEPAFGAAYNGIVTELKATAVDGFNAKEVEVAERLLTKAVKEGATVDEMKAALDAYNKLTDRQKYDVDASYVQMAKVIEKKLGTVVESLKLKVTTKAYKGYIKVSWKVTGDAEAADGYQIYRSTKTTSAGKKIYTTKKATSRSYKNSSVKKGTKYYYKVRAFKVVDGVTYYSDWSTRGIRTAK